MRIVIYKNKLSVFVLCIAIISSIFASIKHELNQNYKKKALTTLYEEANILKNIGLIQSSKNGKLNIIEKKNSLTVFCFSKDSVFDMKKFETKLSQNGWKKLNDWTYEKGYAILQIKKNTNESMLNKNNSLYINLCTRDAY